MLSQIYNLAYLFDPMTGDVKPTSSPQTGIGNSFPTSTILRDGKILFLSNSFSVGAPTSAEIYDPETESWSTVDLPTFVDKTVPARLAATLPDGKALGFFNMPNKQRVSITFDSVAKSWGDTTIRYLDTSRAITLPTGELFAFQYNAAEIYSTTSKSWRTVNSPVQLSFNSVLLASGQVYIGNEIYGVDFGSLTPRPALTAVNASAASFRVEPLARGSIVSLFGSNFTGIGGDSSSADASDVTPFNIIDGNGAVHQVRRVFTNTPNQINYLMPDDILAGQALMTLASGEGKRPHVAMLSVVDVAPGLFTANASGKGRPAAVALRVKADGSQSYESIVNGIDLGSADESVFLVLFGTGIHHRTSLDHSLVYIGGVKTPALYAGKQGDVDGMDQINVQIPRSLAGRGDVVVLVTVDGKTANPVTLRIK